MNSPKISNFFQKIKIKHNIKKFNNLFSNNKKLKLELIQLEQKYGGLTTNIKRNVISKFEKNYYTNHRGG